jgi:hypothetical protein
MDNLSMSFMEANMMTKASHPSYSHDLAQSDFFLFGEVKEGSADLPLAKPMNFLRNS